MHQINPLIDMNTDYVFFIKEKNIHLSIFS